MELNEIYLNKSYHDAMVLQYKDSLNTQGFTVELDKKIQYGDLLFDADLYASKEGEARLYEFKLIGNGRMPGSKQRQSITRFKEIAASVNAKPFVVYVNPVIRKDIEVEGLEESLLIYMKSQPGLPFAIEMISPDAMISSLQLEKVGAVHVNSQIVIVDGTATLFVTFPTESDGEVNEGFPMHFKAVLTVKDDKLLFSKIETYSVDISDWHDYQNIQPTEP